MTVVIRTMVIVIVNPDKCVFIYIYTYIDRPLVKSNPGNCTTAGNPSTFDAGWGSCSTLLGACTKGFRVVPESPKRNTP